MCTYETWWRQRCRYGLAPLVVPQLKTITVGGAATGGGIESSSFRSGLVFDDIVEIDVLTGAGEVITATPDRDTPTCSTAFPTPTEPSATPPGCGSSWSRSSRLSRCGTYGSTDSTNCRRDRRDRRRPAHDGVRRRLPRRSGLQQIRELSDPRHSHRRTGPDQRLHRAADLLPIHSAAGHRSADHPRLSVALGHRLVLVLTGFRRATTAGAPALAETTAAQLLLLEAGRAGPPVRHRRPASNGCTTARRWSGSCRTSRSRWTGPRTS